ncbi:MULTISPECIES: hypothetical protein [Burkholderia cepacia complex]|uniref:hypothetical protein n=1 Tax=Burkholderia cepacia complex TaxID=87882 RepID=UPI00158C3814|nr:MULTISPECIES: hypothetical protein [Burkholderia cepacia complex]MCA8022731.1 type II and III secretion system protein [Burkholderia metallica]
MKKPLIALAIALVITQANAGDAAPPFVEITLAKEGQTLLRGTHRFVDASGALVPFAATAQQKFPYSTCTLDGGSPRFAAKQLPIGRMLILKPQRTPRGPIHLDIQAEDTEVKTVKSTAHGPCISLSPVTGGLPLTTVSVELPEQGAVTVSFPDGHYALTLKVERDSK